MANKTPPAPLPDSQPAGVPAERVYQEADAILGHDTVKRAVADLENGINYSYELGKEKNQTDRYRAETERHIAKTARESNRLDFAQKTIIKFLPYAVLGYVVATGKTIDWGLLTVGFVLLLYLIPKVERFLYKKSSPRPDSSQDKGE